MLRQEMIFLDRRQGIAQQTASTSKVPDLDKYQPGDALFESIKEGVEEIQ
jgi:hypothetical protein